MQRNTCLDYAHIVKVLLEHIFHTLQGTRMPKKPRLQKCKDQDMAAVWQALHNVRTERGLSLDVTEDEFTLDDIELNDTIQSFVEVQSENKSFKKAIKTLVAAVKRAEDDLVKEGDYDTLLADNEEVKTAHKKLILTQAEVSHVIERKKSIWGPAYINDHSRRPFYKAPEKGTYEVYKSCCSLSIIEPM